MAAPPGACDAHFHVFEPGFPTWALLIRPITAYQLVQVAYLASAAEVGVI